MVDTRLEMRLYRWQVKTGKPHFALLLDSLLSNTTQPALAFISTKPHWWFPFNQLSTRTSSFCRAAAQPALRFFDFFFFASARRCTCLWTALRGHCVPVRLFHLPIYKLGQCLSRNAMGKQLFWWNAHCSLVKKENPKLNSGFSIWLA